MRQHEVAFTDNDFRIALREGAFEVCIEHRCQRGLEGRKHLWEPHVWSVAWRDKHCSWCSATPSEGLQASFWFLKEG